MSLLNAAQNQNLALRDYQQEVISKIYHFFDLKKVSVLLYAPTGAGKTVIASQIIADYVGKGKRVLFLVHRGKLVRQTYSTLQKNFGISASIIWADYDKPDYENQVQIAMLQTIQNRELPPDIDLVILDEAHTGSYYKIWQRVLNKYSGAVWTLSKTQYIGLSASPWRSKQNQGYCQFFQAIVRAPYPEQLIHLGHLCRARQFGYTNLIDESKLKVVDGEFTEDSMRSVCTPALNQEILEKYLERDPSMNRKSIAFCASVEQAVDLRNKFNEAGISAESIVGTTPEEERERIFSRYAQGEIKLISSVGVLCEGFDEPSVTAVLVCRPVKSKALWVQMNGRGLRLFNGKEDCWFLDYCNNINRLGLPTSTFSLSLCPEGKPTVPTISTKTCPECGSIVRFYEKVCPFCGFIFPNERKQASRKRHKFLEILSPEQREHLKFLRNRIANAFNKGRSSHNIETLFFEEFGYNPPEDWFDGLIFGDEFAGWEANVQHYWRYLIATTTDPGSEDSKSWMRQCIKREFKSLINYVINRWTTAFTSSNTTEEEIKSRVDERLQSVINYKTWWAILDLKSPPDVKDLDFAYKQCRSKYEYQFCDKPRILETCMELIGIAMQEGIDYHSQDKNIIDKSVSLIRNAISRGHFSYVKSHVMSLSPTTKERIWSLLTHEEKRAYRRWQEGDTSTLESNSNSYPTVNTGQCTSNYYSTATERTQERKNFVAIPSVKRKPVAPPPINEYSLQKNHTQVDSLLSTKAPFNIGESVRYVGNDPTRREQYAGVLTVHSLNYGKVSVLTADGYLSTWLNYQEIKRI